MRTAEWLVKELDRPVSKPEHSADEFPLGESNQESIRVFRLANAATTKDLQQIAVGMRSLGDVRRVFTYNGRSIIVIRGTADQLALSQWLFDQLDQPAATTQSKQEYQVPGSNDDLVGVFYLRNSDSPGRLQDTLAQVRNAAAIRRICALDSVHAIALRGAASQIVQADALISAQKQ